MSWNAHLPLHGPLAPHALLAVLALALLALPSYGQAAAPPARHPPSATPREPLPETSPSPEAATTERSTAATRFVPANDPRIAVIGRATTGEVRVIGYPGVTLRLRLLGSTLRLRAASTTGHNRLGVLVDGTWRGTVTLPAAGCEGPLPEVTAVAGLGPGPHTVELVHQNETWQGVVVFAGVELPAGGELLPPSAATPRKRLLVLGDSVTCGEALLREPGCAKSFAAWDPYDSYGMRLGRLLDLEVSLVCYGGRGLIRDWQGRRDGLNAYELFSHTVALEALPSELACRVASDELAWNAADYVPDVVIVSFGSNDFNLALGALPEREEYVGAYLGLLKALLESAPATQVLLTEGAIVDDADPRRPQKATLRAYLQETIRRLASPRVHFAPAVHYPGDACDAHPTREQHARMAEDLLPYVRRALEVAHSPPSPPVP